MQYICLFQGRPQRDCEQGPDPEPRTIQLDLRPHAQKRKKNRKIDIFYSIFEKTKKLLIMEGLLFNNNNKYNYNRNNLKMNVYDLNHFC